MLGALFGFRGRLSRPGFWEVLASIVLIDALIVLGGMYLADSGLPGGTGPSDDLSQTLVQAAPWAMTILTGWCLLAAGIKRLHDRGRPGALILLALIPLLGWLWLLVDLFLLEGEERRNRYGPPPHSHAPERAAPQRRFDWGAETAAAPEPPPAAMRFDPPPPEPALPEPPLPPSAPEPVHVQAQHLELHVLEHHAPEPEPAVHEEPAHVAEPVDPGPEPHAAPPSDVIDLVGEPAPVAHAEAPAEPAHPEPLDEHPLVLDRSDH